MTYNLSFMENTTGLYEIVEGVNTATNGWLIGLVMILVWLLIIFIFQRDTDMSSLVLGSSFIMSIITGMFFFLGFVESWVLIIPILGIIVGIVFKFMEG